MKKWYKIILFLSLISGILANGKKVFAAEVDKTEWINWRTHVLNNYSNPVVGYGESSSHIRPWYCDYLEDNSKGVLIKYDNANDSVGARYYYLSYVNTASCSHENRANGNITSYSMGTNNLLIDNDFFVNFPDLQGKTIYSCMWQVPLNQTPNIVIDNYDFSCTSSLDLKNQLDALDYTNPEGNNPNTGQMPYFYLKVVGPAGNHNTFMGDVEYTLTWDTTNSFIQDQRDYYIQVYCWSGNENDFFTNWDHKKAINNSDTSPYNMGMVAFTWSFVDMERLWIMNNWAQHHFKISLRIVDATGTPVNNKWVNFTVTKMYEITSSSMAIDNNGAPTGETTNLGERTDGVFSYTDGRPTGDNTNGEGGINSNGSSVSPQASQQGITNYTPTYDYGNYNFGSSLQGLEDTLTDMVQTIGMLPNLFSQIASFMPSWLISLIGVSIGMLVLIGIVKTLT